MTGRHGCGKTALQRLVRELLGHGIVSITDGSAAGIWQRLVHSAEPIGYDEIEAKRDGEAQAKIVELMRHSASGGSILRGNADHNGVEFTARSCFLCSSILVPPMGSQDRSRITILELGALEKTDLPVDSPEDLNALGAQLRRRIADGWTRFTDTFSAYRSALIDRGHDARAADQLASLLAPADLLLSDCTPARDELAAEDDSEMAQLLNTLTPTGTIEDTATDVDHVYCFNHLLSTQLDTFRHGAKVTVGHWIAEALADYEKGLTHEKTSDAALALAQHGLRLVDDGGKPWLAVANCHAGLSKIFYGTNWAGRSDSVGVWVQALRRLPTAKIGDRARFAGTQTRCTLIPIDALQLKLERENMAATTAAPTQPELAGVDS